MDAAAGADDLTYPPVVNAKSGDADPVLFVLGFSGRLAFIAACFCGRVVPDGTDEVVVAGYVMMDLSIGHSDISFFVSIGSSDTGEPIFFCKMLGHGI